MAIQAPVFGTATTFKPIGAAAPVAGAQEMSANADRYNDDQKAAAFQQHLQKGLQGMTEILGQLPEDVKAVIPDPATMADTDEKRTMWYMSVNQAVNKSNMRQASANGDTRAVEQLGLNDPSAKPEDFAKAAENQNVDNAVTGTDFTTTLPPEDGAFQFKMPVIDAATSADRRTVLETTKAGVDAKLAPYEEHIKAMAAKYNVPTSLIKATIARESRGITNADAPGSSAKGLMQLIDSTAKAMGVTDPLDPLQNIEGGTKYLGTLLKLFDGDMEKASAAYHEGETKLGKLVRANGDSWKENISDEAKAYLPDVMLYADLYGGAGGDAGVEATAGAPKVRRMTKPEIAQALMKNFHITVEKAKSVSEIMGGSDIDGIESLKLALRAKGLGIAEKAEERRGKSFDYKQEQDINTNIQKYVKQAGDSPQIGRDLNELDDLVDLDSTKPIPGVGWGAKPFRNWLLASNPESAPVRKIIASLFTRLGHKISGANFTEREMANLETMLGMTFFDTEESFRMSMRRLRKETKGTLKDAAGGLGDAAKAAAEERGVFTDEQMRKTGASPDTESATKPIKKTYDDPEKEARYQAYKLKNKKP